MSDAVEIIHGDSREVLKAIPDDHFDSCVTDPPYALVSIQKRFGKPGSAPAKGNDAYMRASAGFMGQQWDTGETAFDPEFWREVLRVMKPGAHLVAFSGTRTYHRMACAIEDAGFEIREMHAWLFGSGFPKSHNVSKGIDKAAGATREVIRERYTAKRIKPGATVVREGGYGKQDISFTATDTAPATEDAAAWQGWGTATKPALEPICLARKPLSEKTVAANVLRWGTGALNIDGCRVQGAKTPAPVGVFVGSSIGPTGHNGARDSSADSLGRWPANVIHDGSEEVIAAFPQTTSGTFSGHRNEPKTNGIYGGFALQDEAGHVGDSGSAARFFYTAKADADDRLGSSHPTVKPVDLMQWLVRLVTRKGGLVLDPFAGTGTTGEACIREGMRAVLIEREEKFVADIHRRMALAMSGPEERARATIKEKIKTGRLKDDPGPLFAETAA